LCAHVQLQFGSEEQVAGSKKHFITNFCHALLLCCAAVHLDAEDDSERAVLEAVLPHAIDDVLEQNLACQSAAMVNNGIFYRQGHPNNPSRQSDSRARKQPGKRQRTIHRQVDCLAGMGLLLEFIQLCDNG
jgi:hypothetical protein